MIDIEKERAELVVHLARAKKKLKGENRKYMINMLMGGFDSLDIIEATREDGGFQWLLELVEYSDVLKQDSTSLIELKAETKAQAVKEATKIVKDSKDYKRARLYKASLAKEIKL